MKATTAKKKAVPSKKKLTPSKKIKPSNPSEMKFSASTQTRRNFIVRLLKNAPEGGLTNTEIYKRVLEEFGENEASRKTIDRDLKDYLSIHSGVYVVDEKAGTKRYEISPDYAETLEITINEEHLQAINLALGLLSKLGPKGLSHIVTDAENALVATLPKDLKRDFENFKEMQLIAPSLAGKAIVENAEIIPLILTALRKKKMIECEYFSKGRGALEMREIGPAFLELFGGSPYLLAEDPSDKNKLKRFKLSRMGKVKILNQRYTSPEKEDCAKHLDSFAGVGGLETEVFNVQIKGNVKLYEHFLEIQLHPSQKLTLVSKDECLLEFMIPESYPFYRYLAGLGGWITSIEPRDVMWQVRAIWRKGVESMGMGVTQAERERPSKDEEEEK